jgi:peptidyl-prolyl cis-trans isomerase-like 4
MDQLEGMSQEEIDEYMKEREARTRAKLLEIIGDLPDADMKPPENVLFVCKLNPVTNDEDLELIFSRFGKINSCEVIRDRKSGDSLCYAFIEFDREEDCENAYFKMDNVLIDDRRIHVDFSQSVSKVNWKGKGTGTGYFQDNKDFMSKDEKKPKYKINTKSRKEEGYDLILDNDSDKEDKKEKRYESVGRKNYQNNKPNYINQRRNDSNDKGKDLNDYRRYNDSKKYKYDANK